MLEHVQNPPHSSTKRFSSIHGALAVPFLLCFLGLSTTAAWGQHYAAPGGLGVAPCTDPVAPCPLALAIEAATGVPGRTVFIKVESLTNPTTSFTGSAAEDLTGALDADITFDAYLDATQQGNIPGAVVTLGGDIGLTNAARLTLGGLDLELTGEIMLEQDTAIRGPGALVFAGTTDQMITLAGAQNSLHRATIEKLKLRKEARGDVEINEASTARLQVPDSLILENGIFTTNGLLDANGTATVVIHFDGMQRGFLDAGKANRAYHSLNPEDVPFKVLYTGTSPSFTGKEVPSLTRSDPAGTPVPRLPVLEVAKDNPETAISLAMDLQIDQELILTGGIFHVGPSQMTLKNGMRITMDEGTLVMPEPPTRGRFIFPEVKKPGTPGADLRAGRDGIDLRYIGSTDRTVSLEWPTNQPYAIRTVTIDLDAPGVQVTLPPDATVTATNTVHVARGTLALEGMLAIAAFDPTKLQIDLPEAMVTVGTADKQPTGLPEGNSFTLIGLDHLRKAPPVYEVISVAQPDEKIPDSFTLHGNYPNPFNASTTIRLDVPEAMDIEVDVFDVLGRAVLTLPAQRKEPGADQTIQLDASTLASGLYLYRVTARTATGTHVRTGQMKLIR